VPPRPDTDQAAAQIRRLIAPILYRRVELAWRNPSEAGAAVRAGWRAGRDAAGGVDLLSGAYTPTPVIGAVHVMSVGMLLSLKVTRSRRFRPAAGGLFT